MKGIREELIKIVAAEVKTKRDTENLRHAALSKRGFVHIRISDIKATRALKAELQDYKL